MKTKLAVIGDPIEHSLSPCIHSAVLESLETPWEYQKIHVTQNELGNFMKDVSSYGLCGFNVTMPHKTAIMQYLDEIDFDAKNFNAVNTVKIKDGKLLGYNTDGEGCMRAILDKGYSGCGSNVVILGAGGVASTIALKLAADGANKIIVLNRTLSSAEKLCMHVKNKVNFKIDIGLLDTETIARHCEDCDILINCTPLGMQGISEDFSDFSFISSLKKSALVFDLIYSPPETRLLKEAAKQGLCTMNGLDMLIYQGLVADEIFFEKQLDFSFYKDTIIRNIEKIKK